MNPLVKRHLPPAPEPTRDRKNPRMNPDGSVPSPATDKTFGDESTRRRVRAYCDRRREASEKRRAIVAAMAREGYSDEAIAEEMGYCKGSVRRILSIMRREGKEIPERKRGVKCKG